ncbi:MULTISPECIES: hypothetical protein [unclassified Halobacteriovorax]|uniref:hypothetical protein n=1 Tax=unclassified Halobacteriovorax TaxID=2639665 RepID=UPI000EA2C53A|nr:hypothetical protein [Halobacteriovorax sp. BALOs_7]AYF43648.1 putative lipoprotein [Halobacteriovorax sp. BALOs_7]
MHRKFIKALGLVFLSTLLFTSCAKKASNTTVTISKSSFLVGDLSNTFDGGVLIIGKNLDSNQSFQLALDPTSPSTIDIELPFGTYDVKAIGWHDGATPTKMKGTRYCSQITSVVDQNETPMQLNMTQATCASLTNLNIYDGTTNNDFNIEACHGVVKVPGLGERDSCGEAGSIARSLKVKYLSIDADGNLNNALSLTSECVDVYAPGTENEEYFQYRVSDISDIVQGEAGYKTPIEVTAYRLPGCPVGGDSVTRRPPRPADIPNDKYFKIKKSDAGLDFMIGINSCNFPGALTAAPFANGAAITKNSNVICTVNQFNEIANYPDKEFIIGQTIDFGGTPPTTASSTHFSGYIEGDIWMSETNIPHIKGLPGSLFFSLGSNVLDYSAGIEHLNIDVSSITDGPVIAKMLKYDSEFYSINLTGHMTNSSPSFIPDGTSIGDTCGALFNQVYYTGAGSQVYAEVDFEKITFSNFKLTCNGLSGTNANYIGGLIGAATSGNTETATNRTFRFDRIEGDIFIEVDSTNANQSIGGLIGLSENQTTIDTWSNKYSITNTFTSSPPRIIGGLLGQHQSTAANSMGKLHLNDNNIHTNILSNLGYGAIQGAGGLVGKVFNPDELYIRGSIVTGNINTNLKNAGGIIGHLYFESNTNSASIQTTLNNATVLADGSAGGIIGGLSIDNFTNVYLSTVTNRGQITGAIGSSSNEGVGGIVGSLLNSTAGSSLSISTSSNRGSISSVKGHSTVNAAGSIVGLFNTTALNFSATGVYADISDIKTAGASRPYFIGFINDLTSANISTNFYLDEVLFSGYTSTSPLSETLTYYGDNTNQYAFTYGTFGSSPFPASLNDHPLYTLAGDSKLDLFLNKYMLFDSNGRSIINGSESSPFLIKAKSDIGFVNTSIGAKFSWRLTTNIDMGGDFLQLSPTNTPFEGDFDGNGYTISNFTNDYSVLSTLMPNNGIFPHVSYGRIKNLNLKGGNVTFKCSPMTYNGSGVLIGQLSTSGQWDGNGDPQLFNLSVSNTNITMPSGSDCKGASPFIGYFNSDNGEDAARFQNISIINNTIDASKSAGLVGYIYLPSSTTFPFKNVEVVGNKFIGESVTTSTSSSAFFGASIASGIYTSYENVLFIGDVNGDNPGAITNDENLANLGASTDSLISNAYAFFDGGQYIQGTAFTNNGATSLADIGTTSFDDYFIHDATVGTVRLDREYITEEIYD